jgi:uncharacterized membrane protein
VRLRDESGMVGKIIVIWLAMVAIVGIAGVDTASIVFTKFQLSDTASNAATAAANAYTASKNVQVACQAAADSVKVDDANATVPKNGCKIDARTGTATIAVRKVAHTVVAGRLSFTRDLTRVTQRETRGPSTL